MSYIGLFNYTKTIKRDNKEFSYMRKIEIFPYAILVNILSIENSNVKYLS